MLALIFSHLRLRRVAQLFNFTLICKATGGGGRFLPPVLYHWALHGLLPQLLQVVHIPYEVQVLERYLYNHGSSSRSIRDMIMVSTTTPTPPDAASTEVVASDIDASLTRRQKEFLLALFDLQKQALLDEYWIRTAPHRRSSTSGKIPVLACLPVSWNRDCETPLSDLVYYDVATNQTQPLVTMPGLLVINKAVYPCIKPRATIYEGLRVRYGGGGDDHAALDTVLVAGIRRLDDAGGGALEAVHYDIVRRGLDFDRATCLRAPLDTDLLRNVVVHDGRDHLFAPGNKQVEALRRRIYKCDFYAVFPWLDDEYGVNVKGYDGWVKKKKKEYACTAEHTRENVVWHHVQSKLRFRALQKRLGEVDNGETQGDGDDSDDDDDVTEHFDGDTTVEEDSDDSDDSDSDTNSDYSENELSGDEGLL